MTVTIPHPLSVSSPPISANLSKVEKVELETDLLDDMILSKFSSLEKALNVKKYCYEFVDKLKFKVQSRKNGTNDSYVPSENFYMKSLGDLISRHQRKSFPDVLDYFSKQVKRVKDMPTLIANLNLYVDRDGLIRVRAKLRNNFPILLSSSDKFTKLLILYMHKKCNHAGCYHVLSEIRNKYHILKGFSTVKKVLKQCVICARFNNRPFKLSQNAYRDFRMDPKQIPFNYIFIDHLGPFHVNVNGKSVKVWLLCFTCLFSRAVNLEICHDMSTVEFLRSFQCHSYKFGTPSFVRSDLGSSTYCFGGKYHSKLPEYPRDQIVF